MNEFTDTKPCAHGQDAHIPETANATYGELRRCRALITYGPPNDDVTLNIVTISQQPRKQRKQRIRRYDSMLRFSLRYFTLYSILQFGLGAIVGVVVGQAI